MAKGKEGGYRVPDEKKKTCPYCGERISKQGWKMHYNFKHPKEEFVPFEEASGDKPTKQKKKEESSGGESFRGEGSGEENGEGKTKKDDGWGDFDEW